MNLDSIRVFCDVAETRSFSRGAEKNGIAQSTASQAVAQLEKRLGAQLLDRSTRPLKMTDQGLIYYDQCMSLLDHYETMTQRIKLRARENEERIIIAAMYSLLFYDVDAIIKKLIMEYRGIHIDVKFLTDSPEISKCVSNGDADIGLAVFGESNRDLIAETWREDPLVVICSTDNPLAHKTNPTLMDLTGMEFFGWNSGIRLQNMIMDYLEKRGLKSFRVTDLGNIEYIKHAVATSRGYSIVPLPSVVSELKAGKLAAPSIANLNLSRPYTILRARNRQLGEPAKRLVELLLNMAAPLTVQSLLGDQQFLQKSGSSPVAEPA